MKVYRRAGFLKLPLGIIYAKGVPWVFGGLCVKGKSLPNDWIYLDPTWVEGADSGDAFDKLDDMLENGASHPGQESWGRDGCFDEDAVFLVYEMSDLASLREHLDDAMKAASELG